MRREPMFWMCVAMAAVLAALVAALMAQGPAWPDGRAVVVDSDGHVRD